MRASGAILTQEQALLANQERIQQPSHLVCAHADAAAQAQEVRTPTSQKAIQEMSPSKDKVVISGLTSLIKKTLKAK